MAQQLPTLPVDFDLRPAYYDQFQCLAGGCRYTCCKGWHVGFSKKDYLALKRQEGSPELTETLQKIVRRVKKGPNAGRWYGEFDLRKGSCPLQREDGLCSLQLEKGPEALPEVCRVFPRGKAYGDSAYLERFLTPACEGVLELLWNLPEGVDFVSDPLPKVEQKVLTFEAEKALCLRTQDVRSQCIDLLQDRRYTLPQRMLLMGLALKELADGERDIDLWLARTQARADAPETAGALVLPSLEKALPMFLLNNVKLMFSTAVRTGDFAKVPEEVAAGLGIQMEFQSLNSANASLPHGPYLAARARFEENFKDRAYFMENLMVSLFFNLQVPNLGGPGELWKSYVDFCNLYSFFRFMAVASCREGASGDKAELFRMVVCASRGLIHNTPEKARLRDELFQNDSATLAHMAILLGG
ncbi:MAG: hypothetical protein HFF18_09980 [Oscillospiraceae bacterium]|nr:hypothetical protein [Oscillospiraceae bacterium]